MPVSYSSCAPQPAECFAHTDPTRRMYMYLYGKSCRRLPTAAARVRAMVRTWGICGAQSGTRARFLREFGFLCHPFHRLLHTHHHHHPSSGVGTIGQTVANVPSGLSLTPPQEATSAGNVIQYFPPYRIIDFLENYIQLMHCYTALPFVSTPVSDRRRISDQCFTARGL
jgi:hypothetical protein